MEKTWNDRGQRTSLNIFMYFSLQIVSFNGKTINGPNVSLRSNILEIKSESGSNNLISISRCVLHIFYYNSCPISPITRIVLQNFYSSIPLYPWDISAQLSIFSTKFYLIVRLLVGIFIFGFMLISSIKMRNSPFSLTLK